MLHRLLASLVCVLGGAAIAVGIASATVWRPSDTLVAGASAAPGSTLLVTDPGVLTMADPEVTVRATGDDVVIALGRTEDVMAWVGGDAHTRVTGLADWDLLATEDVPAESPEPDADPDADVDADPDAADADPDADADVDPEAADADPEAADADPDAAEEPEVPAAPNPAGSDLWWDEVTGSSSAEFEWTEQDGRWSILVASTGVGAGAPGVTLTWPQEVHTPWLWPGVVVGSLLLLLGMAWWALILVATRRHARSAAQREAEPAVVAEPSAPLTRRQLREAAEQQPRRRRSRERGSIIDRFPMLVPAPRPAPEPEEDARGSDDDARGPDDARARRDPARRSDATSHSDDDARRIAAAAAAAVPPAPQEGPDASAAAPFASPPSERKRRLRLWRRRASSVDAPRSSGTDARADTATSRDPRAEGGASAQQPLPMSREGAPAASADAWRRAWGLNEDDDADQHPSTDGADR